jgi:heme a synthase
MCFYRPLLVLATLLAFGVVGLGAYVRLSDAGLGCPDWPGCYGHLLGVPEAPHEQALAQHAFPGKPVQAAKAWKEMAHRYVAGTLGLLILALTLLAWRHRVATGTTSLLAGVVVFQALLGMWTVTLLLKPVIVTAHLLGGMTTLALLVWLVGRPVSGNARRPHPPDPAPDPAPYPGPRLAALAALLVVLVQIALGGWVSSNYAALACTDFPTCQQTWLPAMDFATAFTLHRELGQTAEGGLLPFTALTAIHWLHRVGAMVVVIVVGTLSWRLMKLAEWRLLGQLLAGLLLIQAGLGIANVLLSLPLPVAVAHNIGAALLLATLVTINVRCRP